MPEATQLAYPGAPGSKADVNPLRSDTSPGSAQNYLRELEKYQPMGIWANKNRIGQGSVGDFQIKNKTAFQVTLNVSSELRTTTQAPRNPILV